MKPLHEWLRTLLGHRYPSLCQFATRMSVVDRAVSTSQRLAQSRALSAVFGAAYFAYKANVRRWL